MEHKLLTKTWYTIAVIEQLKHELTVNLEMALTKRI